MPACAWVKTYARMRLRLACDCCLDLGGAGAGLCGSPMQVRAHERSLCENKRMLLRRLEKG